MRKALRGLSVLCDRELLKMTVVGAGLAAKGGRWRGRYLNIRLLVPKSLYTIVSEFKTAAGQWKPVEQA